MLPDYKRICRIAAGAHRSCPVVIIKGDQPPALTGESWYYTTPSGKTRISYPASYRWPKLYHHSSLRVEVGDEWLASQETAEVLVLESDK